MDNSIKRQTLKGVKWTSVESLCVQGFSFVIGIILARLLTPTDYGTIAVLSIFIGLSETFIDSGFSQAIIRKPDLKDADCNTAFVFNIITSAILYIILYICAPFISDFFKMPILTEIVKIYSLVIVIGAFGSVQISRLTIALDFKLLAKINITSTLTSGILGVILAFYGFGVWALVWQSLCSRGLYMILVWSASKWKPKLQFIYASFKELFSFGGNMLCASLLWTFYNNLTPIIIGKYFSAKALGQYNRGTSLVSYPSSVMWSVLDRVTFPILAKIQHDTVRLINVYQKYIKITSLIIMFGLMLMASLAKPIVLILLTEKWYGCIIYMQIFVFSIVFDHIQKINLNLIKVTGHSKYVLKLEFVKRIISLAILFASIPFGVIGICVSRVIYTQIALILNTYYTGKLFGLGYVKQYKDFCPYLLLSMVSCLPTYIISLVSNGQFTSIIIGTLLSITIYTSTLYIIKDKIFLEYAIPILTKIKTKVSSLIS